MGVSQALLSRSCNYRAVVVLEGQEEGGSCTATLVMPPTADVMLPNYSADPQQGQELCQSRRRRKRKTRKRKQRCFHPSTALLLSSHPNAAELPLHHLRALSGEQPCTLSQWSF